MVCATLPRSVVPAGTRCNTPGATPAGSLVWMRWLHSFDRLRLAETGYPGTGRSSSFTGRTSRKEADGPPYPDFQQSRILRKRPRLGAKIQHRHRLIRRTCEWIVEMEEALGKSELTASAKEVRAQLVPYHLTARKNSACGRTNRRPIASPSLAPDGHPSGDGHHRRGRRAPGDDRRQPGTVRRGGPISLGRPHLRARWPASASSAAASSPTIACCA